MIYDDYDDDYGYGCDDDDNSNSLDNFEYPEDTIARETKEWDMEEYNAVVAEKKHFAEHYKMVSRRFE